MEKEVRCGCRAAVAAIVFLSIPVADYQRDEDAMKRGRDMPLQGKRLWCESTRGRGETFGSRYEKNRR